ncbi:MAG TPA: redox-sensing transcriptional repressor Rex, partial [Clostridiales bacterium]|nr:redox-sensing transcriptional repressor Rex [Clostridiales bacterium]
MNAGEVSIPKQTFHRLPGYYNYLKMLRSEGVETVSSTTIARDLRLGEVQVRKDLACISKTGGRPRTGFSVAELIDSIEYQLGYNRMDEAVLVGAGNLGRALLSYSGFEEIGINIVAAFDRDESVVGQTLFGKQVLPISKLSDLCQRMHILIGIIAVPGSEAQQVCDLLVSAGIAAIWNFAPVHLTVPDDV